jgi:hypothetical protein
MIYAECCLAGSLDLLDDGEAVEGQGKQNFQQVGSNHLPLWPLKDRSGLDEISELLENRRRGQHNLFRNVLHLRTGCA